MPESVLFKEWRCEISFSKKYFVVRRLGKKLPEITFMFWKMDIFENWIVLKWIFVEKVDILENLSGSHY